MNKKIIAVLSVLLLVFTALLSSCNLTKPIYTTEKIQESNYETHVIKTYTLIDPNEYPYPLRENISKVKVEKNNTLDLVRKVYNEAKLNSDGFIKEKSEIADAQILEDILYVTLDEEFTKSWSGGTFYESIVFDTLTASFTSIEGINKVKYDFKGEIPSLHIDIENSVFTGDLECKGYKIIR